MEQLRAGVELILKQMEEALKGLNVQPVESGGRAVRPPHPRGAGEHRNGGVSGPPGSGRDSARVQDPRQAAAAGAGTDCGESEARLSE